jgi:hypothetical protein
MGIMKSIKDMKTMAAAAPGMFDQAQQLKDNAEQLQAANAAAYGSGVAGAPTPAAAVDPVALAPLNGITLEEYARIAKTIGEKGLDQAGTEALVQRIGHTVADWQGASDGWNERFKGNTALSVQFGTIYQTAQVF